MSPFPMIKLAPLAVLLASFPIVAAYAMNWEGHDDWMANLPHALDLQSSMPAVTLPQRPVQICRVDIPRNPYDQIPLATEECPVGSSGTGKVRSGAQP